MVRKPAKRTTLMAKGPASPLDGIELLLADLDGVVYQGPSAIPYAVEGINRAALRCQVGYITNNASRTAASIAKHLSELGLSVSSDDVVTSAQAGVQLLRDLVPAGALVLVVGGEGLTAEVEKAGFAVTGAAVDKPAAVIQGFSPMVGWKQLAEASFALAADDDSEGIPWVATNMDFTIPVAGGIAPGNGTMVSAVHSAVGRLPVVAGKPERAIFDEAFTRFGTSKALFLGDRLSTDILGANRAGIASGLVLTGIDKAKQVLAVDKNSRPSYLFGDLRELHEPYPEAVESKDSATGDRLVTVGRAMVRLAGNVVSIAERGEREIDLLRAAAATIWGSGLAIYALDVARELY
jgi:glycerol 3-phosphatase-2